MKDKEKLNRNIIISASEIGQFCYCSIAWYLQKQGYKPHTELLETGQKKHDELGKLINNAERNVVISRILKLIGYLAFFFSILLLIFKVLL